MKYILSPFWILLICFLLIEKPVHAQSSEKYNSSLRLQYGLFQFNNNQQDFINSSTNSFLSAGLTYKHQLGRITALNLTGRYYEWNLNNGHALKTYAFQSMFVVQARKISSSWRINRITPYIGAGLGYENHVHSRTGADSSYWQFYVPVEAGLQINLNSRWSAGIFSEYKFASFTTLKKLFTTPYKSLDLVNSAGISLTYRFGQNKKTASVPVIWANPALGNTSPATKQTKTTVSTTTKPKPEAKATDTTGDKAKAEVKTTTSKQVVQTEVKSDKAATAVKSTVTKEIIVTETPADKADSATKSTSAAKEGKTKDTTAVKVKTKIPSKAIVAKQVKLKDTIAVKALTAARDTLSTVKAVNPGDNIVYQTINKTGDTATSVYAVIRKDIPVLTSRTLTTDTLLTGKTANPSDTIVIRIIPVAKDTLTNVQEETGMEQITDDDAPETDLVPEQEEETTVVRVQKQIVKETEFSETDTAMRRVVILPKIIMSTADTITVPVILNISVNKTDAKTAVSVAGKAKPEPKANAVYEKKTDSLLIVINRLNKKLSSIDNDSKKKSDSLLKAFNKLNERLNKMDVSAQKKASVKDTVVVRTIRTEPVAQPVTIIQNPGNNNVAEMVEQSIRKTNILETELLKVKWDLEDARTEIQRLSSENDAAINDLTGKVKSISTSPAPDTKATKTEVIPQAQAQIIIPAGAPKVDTAYNVISDSVKLIRQAIDSLSQNQKNLVKELKDVQNQNEELRKKMAKAAEKPEPVVTPVEKEFVLTVTFAVNSSRVGPNFLKDLSDAASLARKSPDKKLQLAGYADKSGKASYNLILSQKRVRAVKAELIKLGVPVKQIVEQYFGSELATQGVNENDRKVVLRVLK